MTSEKFDALVHRLEKEAQDSPKRYAVRVALLACLGYAFLFCALSCLIAVLVLIGVTIFFSKGNLMLLKMAIAPAVAAAAILQALSVSFPKPQGVRLDRGSSPALFAMLDEVRAPLKAPAFHEVLLTEDFNAAVSQVPRLGLFGWQRNYLLLGLPLMQALTPQQFRAVVAHEAGHLSGNHGRFGGWIYRVRQTWIQVLEEMHKSKQRRTAAWFRRFFDWYAPCFSAYSFVLARGNEYQADRCAAEVAGTSAASQALVALELHGRFLQERFWPELYKQVEQKPQPPPVFEALTQAFQTQFAPEDARAYFHQALGAETGTLDTYPSLSDRLRALGYKANLEEAFQEALTQFGTESAAAHCFGPNAAAPQAQLEQEWVKQAAPGWEKQHRQIQEGRIYLSGLNEKAQNGSLTPEEAWRQACLTLSCGKTEDAEALFQKVIAEDPAHSGAQFALGKVLLQQNNPNGLSHLEAAMTADPDTTLEACATAADFCQRQGRREEVAQFQRRAEERRALLRQAHAEREEVGSSARFEPHGLSPAATEELAAQLQQFRDVKTAYVVRKTVKYLPEHPFYVLWIVPGFITSSKNQDILRQIAPQIKFSGQMHIFVVDGSDLRILKIRRSCKDAVIYRRSGIKSPAHPRSLEPLRGRGRPE